MKINFKKKNKYLPVLNYLLYMKIIYNKKHFLLILPIGSAILFPQ